MATNKQVKILQENLITEKTINQFAFTLMDKRTVEEVASEIIRHCVYCMDFLDCIVYQVDEEQQMFIQLVESSLKKFKKLHSHYPLQIPLNKGTLGRVVLNGKGKIVKVITKNKQASDNTQKRYSKIAVPITWEGKVKAVIYASHPQKGFFKPRHLRILTRLAYLSALKIKSIEEEQAFRRSERQLLEGQKRMAEVNSLSLQMQMSSHFMFNSLTSINYFILQENTDLASKLLTKFSRLIRQVLENAKSDWVTLRNELNALRLYIELEQIRCSNKFTWSIEVSECIYQDSIRIPPFILQTYVQHAIWYGLLPKNSENLFLQVSCYKEEDTLVIEIADNGKERKAALLNDPESRVGTLQQGINIAHEQLQVINLLYSTDIGVQINDRYDTSKNLTGTIVTFTIKLPYV